MRRKQIVIATAILLTATGISVHADDEPEHEHAGNLVVERIAPDGTRITRDSTVTASPLRETDRGGPPSIQGARVDEHPSRSTSAPAKEPPPRATGTPDTPFHTQTDLNYRNATLDQKKARLMKAYDAMIQVRTSGRARPLVLVAKRDDHTLAEEIAKLKEWYDTLKLAYKVVTEPGKFDVQKELMEKAIAPEDISETQDLDRIPVEGPYPEEIEFAHAFQMYEEALSPSVLRDRSLAMISSALWDHDHPVSIRPFSRFGSTKRLPPRD